MKSVAMQGLTVLRFKAVANIQITIKTTILLFRIVAMF